MTLACDHPFLNEPFFLRAILLAVFSAEAIPLSGVPFRFGFGAANLPLLFAVIFSSRSTSWRYSSKLMVTSAIGYHCWEIARATAFALVIGSVVHSRMMVKYTSSVKLEPPIPPKKRFGTATT